MLRQLAAVALALAPLSLAQLSDDFENGWDQTKWPTYAPDCSQGGTVSLDSTTAHSGKNSMKTVSPGGYCGHIFFGNNASIPAGNTYVRTWVKPLNAMDSSHISFIVMPDAGLGAGKHLRMGAMEEVMMYNRESDDATLPDMSPQGIATSQDLPAGVWSCLEYHVSSSGLIETWLNGNAVAGLMAGPGTSNPNSNGWGSAYKPDISGVYFGWESYGGAANTMWWDDVAIASSRVGCGASSSTGPTTTGKQTTTAKPSTTTTTSTTLSTSTTTSATGPTVSHYGQCGGLSYQGSTTCASPYTCKELNPSYWQCL